MTYFGDACEVVVPQGASKDEWLAARRDLITASDAAVLTGHHPYQTWDELLERKATGDRFEPNAAMWMGTMREAGNITIFGRCAGVQPSFAYDGVLLRSTAHPWAGATLDSVVVGPSELPRDDIPEELWVDLPGAAREPGTVLEAKNVRSKSRSLWKKKVHTPKSRLFHYWAQVQFQLLVTGRPVGVLFAVVDACELYHHVVERNEKYQALLLEAGPRFVSEMEELRF